jgi:hypothetical protein
MRNARRAIPVLILLLALPAIGRAQTTGSLVGRVTDTSGGVLPGATVEVRSLSLQGVRSTTTDTSGNYRLALLPPGTYAVTFNLASFTARTIENVRVGLDRDTTLDGALSLASLKEAVTVTGEAPVVDTTTTTLGQNLDERAIQTLPTGRNYSSVVQVTPGVSSDANPDNRQQSTISVYGSSGAENTFLIDGVNTTNVEYGFQGKDLNFEFIQEINVKAGGYEAEFGKATGGIINVITKSGSNQFHGDLFGYLDADSLQRDADPVVSTGGTVTGFTRRDFGIDLGGPLVKDRLWFFGAYDRVTNTTDSALPSGPLEGQTVEARTTRNLASAKLTLKLAENQTAVATFFQDPRQDTGVINDASHTLNGDPTTYEGRQDFGGRDYALAYDANFSRSWILSAQVARHEEENSVGPATDAGDVIQYRDSRSDFFQTGGFGLIQEKTFRRNLGRASLTRFAGGHQIKLGAEWEQEKAEVIKRMSGGQQVDVFPNPTGGPQIYRHFYWTTPDAAVGNAPVSQLTSNPEHRNTAVFLQDRWAVSSRLALNFGVRWDRQQIIDAAGTSQIDLKKDFAPRLGFVFDPKGDHRTKVFGSYGRYYEQIPMDLVIRSFSFERQPRIVNFDAVSTQPNLTAEAQFGTDSAILGGFTEPSDPDIKNQFLHEFIAGFEKEIAPDVAFGVKGVYRRYGRVIEDFLCMDDGTYCIGNPSTGLMERVFTLDYSQTFPAPKPRRVYKGLQVDLTKRFSHRWQGLASYVLSKLDGNYDGEYAPFTNAGADPNISAAYDYYDFFTNGRDLDRITNTGPLSNDRRHQFKVSGVYEAPFGLSLGLAAYFRTGTPLTRYGYSDAYSRYEFFLTERGAEGRQPSTYEADIHVGYPVRLGGQAKLNILLDVFSLLNAQRAVLLDQRYAFQEADNFLPAPANPGYGQAVLRTPPTSVRLGVRLSF